MMKIKQACALGFAMVMVFVLLIGCQGTAAPVQFYSLAMPEAPADAANQVKTSGAIAVGVGPLEIPKMLDRPQIVTRDTGNKIHVTDFHRWGGSLNEDILRVLTEHLAGLLQSNQVMSHPWAEFFEPDYRIYLVFHRFDGRLGESLVLNATWTVTDTRGRKALAVKRSVIREPLAAPDYESLVSASGRALEALGQQISLEINRLQGK